MIEAIPKIKKKLNETHQTINKKKTKVDTAYHGIKFLGKISYPYGYQKPSKQVIIRVCQKAKTIQYENDENLLAKTNSHIGVLKKYNCKKLIKNYASELPEKVNEILTFDDSKALFKIINTAHK